MTCIVSVIDDGNVYIGGDSAGVSGYSITPRADQKVFSNGEFIMGFTSSFRMGQVLRYKFEPPTQHPQEKDDYKFMVVKFVDAVKECFRQNSYGDPQNGGTFLVGYRSNLYLIDSDFQVGVSLNKYDSVGCGAELAKGALFATQDKNPIDRIKIALKAAAYLNGGVCEPFNIVKLEKSVVVPKIKKEKITVYKTLICK